MKKILLFIGVIGLSLAQLPAQTKQKTETTNTQTQQKKPPPYVMKTDYDAKMATVDAKVNAAVNAANSVKNEVAGKLDKVAELDAKMLQVEEILNSANFKIASTDDSLKRTRFSVDEFKANTEAQINKLAETDGQMRFLWAGIAVAFLLAGAIILLMNNRLHKMKNSMHKVSEEFSLKLETEMEKASQQQRAYKDEVDVMKRRVQDDLVLLKTDLMRTVNANNESTAQQLQLIMDKLDKQE
ncbi:MAG TPA: hypothetical protein VEC12_12725 [Bacteroidia bacterium]|nr:hypothetical protein [Bacteroidia bacterium]